VAMGIFVKSTGYSRKGHGQSQQQMMIYTQELVEAGKSFRINHRSRWTCQSSKGPRFEPREEDIKLTVAITTGYSH